jgi:predicted metal-binding membrane protein
MLSAGAAVAPARRERILVGLCIAVLTGLSWAYLVRLDREMCLGMGATAKAAASLAVNFYWTPADRWLNFAMWAVMMVGMMAPSAAPMVMLFAAARAGKGKHAAASVLLFSLGYAAVWTLFSAGATMAQWGLQQKAMLSAMIAVASPRAAGVILVAAGAYQLSPWKGKCLMHCRSPLGFLLAHWRGGNAGAFRMGFGHGVYCLGCCWALMLVLFAVGVMNLVWVAGLSVLIFLEKVGPAGPWIARVSGAALVVAGVMVM